MDEKYIALIATFDEETTSQMEALQQLLFDNGLIGTQTPGVPPHITIALFDPALENELIKKTKQIAAKTKRFKLCFNHIGLFGLKVLFLGPDVNHELLTLHEALAVNNVQSVRGWTPHATLLIDEPANIHKALDLINQNFQQIKGRIEGLQLYEIDPVRLVAEYTLQDIPQS